MMWLHGSDFTIKALTTIAFSSVEKRKSNYSVYNIDTHSKANIIIYWHYSQPEKIYHFKHLSDSIQSWILVSQYAKLSSKNVAALQSYTLSKIYTEDSIFHNQICIKRHVTINGKKCQTKNGLWNFTDSKCWKEMDHITNKIDNNLV